MMVINLIELNQFTIESLGSEPQTQECSRRRTKIMDQQAMILISLICSHSIEFRVSLADIFLLHGMPWSPLTGSKKIYS